MDNFEKHLLMSYLKALNDIETDDPIHKDACNELIKWLEEDVH